MHRKETSLQNGVVLKAIMNSYLVHPFFHYAIFHLLIIFLAFMQLFEHQNQTLLIDQHLISLCIFWQMFVKKCLIFICPKLKFHNGLFPFLRNHLPYKTIYCFP